MDELEEELEHQEFLDSLNVLAERIFFMLLTTSPPATFLKTSWDDVKVFGDEPVFTSLLFDMMLKEDER